MRLGKSKREKTEVKNFLETKEKCKPHTDSKFLLLLLLSRVSLVRLCNPMAYRPPGSSVHEILQARILEWIAISFSRGSSLPRDQTWVSCIVGRCFTI